MRLRLVNRLPSHRMRSQFRNRPRSNALRTAGRESHTSNGVATNDLDQLAIAPKLSKIRPTLLEQLLADHAPSDRQE